MREHLSARVKQPGHDRTFRTSETLFVAALRRLLPQDRFEVVDHPRDLSRIFGSTGVVPEASVRHLATGRTVWFEVKRQGANGNAEERACKHHTVAFYRLMREHTGQAVHPFYTVFCDSLSTLDRYTSKFPYLIEEGQYLLWVEYQEVLLREFLEGICLRSFGEPLSPGA